VAIIFDLRQKIDISYTLGKAELHKPCILFKEYNMAANNVETLFTWYFRLNGYFTTPNFTVHKDFRKRPGGGEADLLAVRFPYSKEEPRNYPFFRDEALVLKEKVDFVIAEIKSSQCCINPAWLNKNYRNVQYALKWMGFLHDGKEIEIAAEEIYNTGIWQPENREQVVRMISCGKDFNETLANEKPNLLQIELQRAAHFLHDRFNTGCNQINRANWDQAIRDFADLCQQEHDIERLKKWILGDKNTATNT